MLVFLAGMGPAVLIDRIVPNLREALNPHDPASQKNRRRHIVYVGMMVVLAITTYNPPEGLVTFFVMLGNLVVGMPLTLVTTVYNILEGISITALVYFATRNCKRTILACLVLRPTRLLGAVLSYTIPKPLLSSLVFGTVLGVVVGVMVFLAPNELLPIVKRYSDGHGAVYGLTPDMAVIALDLALFHL